MSKVRATFWVLTLVISICITGGNGYAANAIKPKTPQYENPPAFVPNQVVVTFKPGTPANAKRAAHAQAGGRVINTQAAINADLVEVPRGKVLNNIAVYEHNPNVRYAEHNYIYTIDQRPQEGSDPNVCNGVYFEEQWGLHNTGQSFLISSETGDACSTTGVLDADIDWLEVWESGTYDGNTIKIAVVDTGIEPTHPDLQGKITETWVANQIMEGPEDLIGHGTHVAGIAAAATNNGIGISGVGINAVVGSLKACKCYPNEFFCLTGICEDWDTAEAILYAKDQGYHVINMSFGGPAVSNALQDAVNLALSEGLVLVASAGNSYLYGEQSYPAALEGVISVAATDHYDNLASFSNFGNWVDLAAPGVNILSTYPSAGCGVADCYGWLSGTSMASPIVAGAAALVFSSIGGANPVNSGALRDGVIDAILNNADHTGALGQNMLAWTRYGRLNIQAALTGGTPNNPPTVSINSPPDGASFNTDESISFAGSASYNEDGDLTGSLVWTSHLQGEIGIGGSFSALLGEGSHLITASVTEFGGLEGSDTITVNVGGSGGGDFSLSASPYKERGTKYAGLTWSGATSTNVDVYRDGDLVITTPNDGTYIDGTDVPLGKGGGSATYQVCEANTANCSNSVFVTW